MRIRRFMVGVGNIAAMMLFAYLLIHPQYATRPTAQALGFCATTLVPSLFVYMVLSKIIITLPMTEILTRVIGLEAFALITGTLCGCPVGAKNAVSLYESGRISKKRAEYLCSFTNNASTSFVVGYVGSELFGDITVGVRLLVIQLVSAVLTAIIMKYAVFGKQRLEKASIQGSAPVGLREAVTDSAQTMLNLCACAVFFIVAGGVVSNLLCLGPAADALVKSVLEFSSGCATAAGLDKYAFEVTAFAVGFTGFSVVLQVQSVIAHRLSVKPFLVGKALSGSIMTALAVICG